MAHEVFIPDGSWDFSRGVNSAALTTIRSALVPNGLRRDQTAWLVNATCRGGGILQRTGWQPNTRFSDGRSLYQGGLQPMYQPIDGSNPYFLFLVGGHLIQVIPDLGTVTDLSAKFGVFNPPTVDQAYFLQAEEFAIVQAGDGTTLPLIWDGAKLRRSKGIVNPLVAPGTAGVNEIPAATAMDYYMDRIWYAQGRTFSAGDMVKGPSGTAAYGKRDAILNVTENPLAVGGDGFTIPANDGNIRAIAHTAQLEAIMGQGQLFIFTRKNVYSQYVPVSRAKWIAAGNQISGGQSDNPLQTVALRNNGSVNDRSIVPVNGDLYFQSLEPAVRSLLMAQRDFQGGPGNIPISRNENRILRFNNRALMRFGSGIQFDNRLWQTCLPQIGAAGVTHQAVVPLDFDIISNLDEKLPPAWEGHYEGLDVLQLFVGDFGGLERAFAAAVSRVDGSLEVWEMTLSSRTENGDNRVVWSIDFPALTWGKEFELKQIHAAEVWVDKEFGTVDMQLNFRPDADPCWRLWGEANFCAARNCAEDVTNPVCYPGPIYREGYCFPITFGTPPDTCSNATCWVKRPSSVGFQIQPQLIMKGWCRIRGIILWATMVDRGLYEDFGSCLPSGVALSPHL